MIPAPSALEMFAQRHTRVMQLRLGRSGHDPEHVGDFLVPVPFDVVQNEYLARSIGQPPDRLLEVERELQRRGPDRKSTRLNSSHVEISYAVFCLKKKKKH